MADFASVTVIKSNMNSASQILDTLHTIYNQCVAAQAILSRYQTDAAFKTEADHLFTPAQLAELNAMIVQTSTLQADWAVNHKSALGITS